MSLIVRYSLVGVAVTAAFVNFISCGSQMYKASLADDMPEAGGEANSTDPASPEFGLHAPNGWSSLPIDYTVERNLSPVQVAALQAAINTWERAVGKKLFSFNNSKNNAGGSEFKDLASSLRDGFNGHYDRKEWKKTGKKNEVIATTVWENTGGNYRVIADADIHYNSDIYYISDAINDRPKDEREIVDMQSLALHELGHLLGLAHVDQDIDGSSIMNPSLYIGVGLTTRSLSVGDVERIQKIYGCDGSACNQEETAKEIMLSSSKGSNAAH